MHRISNGTQVTSLPTPAAVTGTPGFATPGVVGSLAATVIDPDAFNSQQEELVAIVLAAGLTLSKTNNGQVLAALQTMFSPIAGAARNLTIKVTSSTTVTVSADGIALRSASGVTLTVLGFSSSLATGTTGLNGLDTGTIAASTWYHVWAVSNGSTTGLVLSLSSSTPASAITVSYPCIARLGAVLMAGSTLGLVATIQKGKKARYLVGGVNVPNLPFLATGNTGVPTTATYVATSVSSLVPPTATAISITCFATSGINNLAAVAPNGSYGAALSATNPPPVQSENGSANPCDLILESTNIYIATQANVGVASVGWEDS